MIGYNWYSWYNTQIDTIHPFPFHAKILSLACLFVCLFVCEKTKDCRPVVMTTWSLQFLDAFERCEKWYLASQCLSVRIEHPGQPLKGFSWSILLGIVNKICRKKLRFFFFLNRTKRSGAWRDGLRRFMICRRLVLGLREISDETSRDGDGMFHVKYFFFRKSCHFWDN